MAVFGRQEVRVGFCRGAAGSCRLLLTAPPAIAAFDGIEDGVPCSRQKPSLKRLLCPKQTRFGAQFYEDLLRDVLGDVGVADLAAGGRKDQINVSVDKPCKGFLIVLFDVAPQQLDVS